MLVRYRGRFAGVKYAVSMAQGFLVARRRVATMRAPRRAIRIRENLGLRRSLSTPRSVCADDQRPCPYWRVRCSETAECNAASSAASELVAVAKESFIFDQCKGQVACDIASGRSLSPSFSS